MVRALVLLAKGGEEMEIVTPVDVLRRASVEVVLAGVEGTGAVECSRQMHLVPDAALKDIDPSTFDLVVVPGGLGGAKVMRESHLVGEVLKSFESRGKLISAICASTTVLLQHGIKTGSKVTSYPSVKKELEAAYQYDDHARVVVDGNVITSRGPGTALEFSLALVQATVGHETASKLASGMLLHPSIHF